MPSKLLGRCMQCQKPHKTLVRWCPKCIQKEMKKYDKKVKK